VARTDSTPEVVSVDVVAMTATETIAEVIEVAALMVAAATWIEETVHQEVRPSASTAKELVISLRIAPNRRKTSETGIVEEGATVTGTTVVIVIGHADAAPPTQVAEVAEGEETINARIIDSFVSSINV